jgi:DNA replication protein DnaC
MIIDHISRLESWLFWRDFIDNHPGKFDKLQFPMSIEAYRRVIGPACPFCHNNGWGPVGEKNIYCVCTMLEWLEQSRRDLQDFETPVKATSLLTLHPLGISPEGDQDLLTLLKGLKSWIEYPHGWLVIQGGNGSGKTHALAAIKTSLNGLAAFISVDRFQQKLFGALEESGKVEELIQNLSTIPILLLDDWGLEHENSWTTDTLASIINRRYMYADEFPTVVTFNTPLGTLLTSPNPAKRRIISRLIDSKISTIYRLRQADYRSPIVQKQIARGGK